MLVDGVFNLFFRLEFGFEGDYLADGGDVFVGSGGVGVGHLFWFFHDVEGDEVGFFEGGEEFAFDGWEALVFVFVVAGGCREIFAKQQRFILKYSRYFSLCRMLVGIKMFTRLW